MPCRIQDKRLAECEQELLDGRQVFRIDVHWDDCTITHCGTLVDVVDGVLLGRPQDGQR